MDQQDYERYFTQKYIKTRDELQKEVADQLYHLRKEKAIFLSKLHSKIMRKIPIKSLEKYELAKGSFIALETLS